MLISQGKAHIDIALHKNKQKKGFSRKYNKLDFGAKVLFFPPYLIAKIMES